MHYSTISEHLSSRATVLLTLWLALAGCSPGTEPISGSRGDAKRGKLLAVQYGCAACHAIPQMPTQGLVGPALGGVGKRAYVAGKLPNTPENIVRWIRFPHEVAPDTLMPDMGISEVDARDLAVFLYGLR